MGPYRTFRNQGRGYRSGSRPGEDTACALLMTATITPPPGAVRRSDPRVRMNDYLSSLQFHLSLPSRLFNRLIFVDNSASDLSPLEELVTSTGHEKLVELISFSGNDHPPAYGKAFGEFKLLDFALTHTSILSERDTFWKISGRLQCLNIGDMLGAAPRRYDVMCDLHNVQTFGLGRCPFRPWMDLRLFSCTVSAYQRLFRGTYEAAKSGFSPGHLYQVVLDARSYLEIVPRFPREPHIAGFSGRFDTDYDSGSLRVKRLVRAALRRTFPRVWL